MKLSVPETRAIPVSLFEGNFRERVLKAKKAGYQGIEVLTAYPEKIEAEDIDCLHQNNMPVSAFGTGALYFHRKLSLLSEDEAKANMARSALYRLIDRASKDGGIITIGSFRGWAKGTPGYEKFIKILVEASIQAAKVNVRLALEPLNRYETNIINNVREGLAFLQTAGMGNLGLVLDTYHMNIEEKDCGAAVEAAGEKLFHLHLGDSNRLPPGKGHFDFQSVIKALKAINYQGYLSAELISKPDADAAGFETAEYFRGVL